MVNRNGEIDGTRKMRRESGNVLAASSVPENKFSSLFRSLTRPD